MAHLEPDRLILLALGESDADPMDTGHLADCQACRDDLAGYREVARLTADTRDLAALPAPSASTWQGIAAQLLPAGAPVIAVATRRIGRRAVRWWPLAAAVAALAGSLTTLGVQRWHQDGDGRVVAIAELRPLAGVGGAGRGTARIVDHGHGLQLEVTVADLPQPAAYYTVWIFDGKNVMVPLGSPGPGPLNLPPVAGDPARYPIVDISAQDLGQQQHGRSLLQGRLRPVS